MRQPVRLGTLAAQAAVIRYGLTSPPISAVAGWILVAGRSPIRWPPMSFEEFAAFVWQEQRRDLAKGDELRKQIVKVPGGRAEAVYFDLRRESTDGRVRRYHGIRYFFFVERRIYQFAYAAAPSDFGTYRTVFERSARTIRFR